jgi:hypothetical protein
MDLLKEWESFYVIVGSSGAALVGLQFVVITLIAERQQVTSQGALRAFGTPTVVHFAGALLISAVMSAPWPTLQDLSIAVTVCAVAGFAYAAAVIRHARRQKEYRPEAEDWVWYVTVPFLVYLALTIASFLLRTREVQALFVIGGSALALVLLGIRNAWDTVTYVLSMGARADAAAEPPPATQPAPAASASPSTGSPSTPVTPATRE